MGSKRCAGNVASLVDMRTNISSCLGISLDCGTVPLYAGSASDYISDQCSRILSNGIRHRINLPMFHDMLPATEPTFAYKMDQPVEIRNGLGHNGRFKLESKVVVS